MASVAEFKTSSFAEIDKVETALNHLFDVR